MSTSNKGRKESGFHEEVTPLARVATFGLVAFRADAARRGRGAPKIPIYENQTDERMNEQVDG
jgi:hypothetical protein